MFFWKFLQIFKTILFQKLLKRLVWFWCKSEEKKVTEIVGNCLKYWNILRNYVNLIKSMQKQLSRGVLEDRISKFFIKFPRHYFSIFQFCVFFRMLSLKLWTRIVGMKNTLENTLGMKFEDSFEGCFWQRRGKFLREHLLEVFGECFREHLAKYFKGHLGECLGTTSWNAKGNSFLTSLDISL